MIADPWTAVLRQLEPNYDLYQTMLDQGPKIVARARQLNLRWRVRIEEDWNDKEIGELYYTENYQKLDERCEWAAEQLKNWRFVTRLSHQEWKFINKKQAEKFLVLFNLKWAQ